MQWAWKLSERMSNLGSTSVCYAMLDKFVCSQGSICDSQLGRGRGEACPVTLEWGRRIVPTSNFTGVVSCYSFMSLPGGGIIACVYPSILCKIPPQRGMEGHIPPWEV